MCLSILMVLTKVSISLEVEHSKVKFDKPVNPEEVKEVLASKEVFESAEAKTFGNFQLKITTKYKIQEENATVDKEVNENYMLH